VGKAPLRRTQIQLAYGSLGEAWVDPNLQELLPSSAGFPVLIHDGSPGLSFGDVVPGFSFDPFSGNSVVAVETDGEVIGVVSDVGEVALYGLDGVLRWVVGALSGSSGTVTAEETRRRFRIDPGGDLYLVLEGADAPVLYRISRSDGAIVASVPFHSVTLSIRALWVDPKPAGKVYLGGEQMSWNGTDTFCVHVLTKSLIYQNGKTTLYVVNDLVTLPWRGSTYVFAAMNKGGGGNILIRLNEDLSDEQTMALSTEPGVHGKAICLTSGRIFLGTTTIVSPVSDRSHLYAFQILHEAVTDSPGVREYWRSPALSPQQEPDKLLSVDGRTVFLHTTLGLLYLYDTITQSVSGVISVHDHPNTAFSVDGFSLLQGGRGTPGFLYKRALKSSPRLVTLLPVGEENPQGPFRVRF
jgi:hypothetical protein